MSSGGWGNEKPCEGKVPLGRPKAAPEVRRHIARDTFSSNWKKAFELEFLLLLGCLCGPVIKWAFGRLRRKTASRGREDTRVWYRETMFSQTVSYDFLLHEPLYGYFLYLVSAPPEKPTKRCEPEEGYLRCSKRFDHGSHSIFF